jgi:hypothetical protein
VRANAELVEKFTAAQKPEWFKGADYAVTVCLLCAGSPVTVSHLTISQRTGCSQLRVKDSLGRLEAAGWVYSNSGKRKKTANTYTVRLELLPLGDFNKLLISQDALALAGTYRTILMRDHGTRTAKHGGTYDRRVPKNWRATWAYRIQKHLNTGSTPEFCVQLFTYVSQKDPRKFVQGPQGWEKLWRQIEREGRKQNDKARST